MKSRLPCDPGASSWLPLSQPHGRHPPIPPPRQGQHSRCLSASVTRKAPFSPSLAVVSDKHIARRACLQECH